MLRQPVCGACACSDGAADQDSWTTADQSTDEHASGSSAARLKRVAAVMALSFELAFFIHIGTADVGVG